MGKTILEEAVDDVQALRKAAEENAKNLLIESVSPSIKSFLDSHLGQEGAEPGAPADAAPTKADAAPQADGDSGEEGGDEDMYDIESDDDEDGEEEVEPTEADPEAVEDGEEDDEANEDVDNDEDDEDEDDEVDEAFKPFKKKAKMGGDDEDSEKATWPKKDKKKKVKGNMDCDESVEITAADLQKAFNEVLKGGLKEDASQGSFKDQQDPNDGEYGLAHKVEGETPWHHGGKVLKKAKGAKMVTKEEHQRVVQKLTNQLAQYQEAFKYLKKNLNEMNLFNAKLVYSTRLMQNNLSDKQKVSVMENIDRAKSKQEVELVYRTLSESLKIAGVLSEARKTVPGAKSQRTTKPGSTLTENKQGLTASKETDRWAELAGLGD